MLTVCCRIAHRFPTGEQCSCTATAWRGVNACRNLPRAACKHEPIHYQSLIRQSQKKKNRFPVTVAWWFRNEPSPLKRLCTGHLWRWRFILNSKCETTGSPPLNIVWGEICIKARFLPKHLEIAQKFCIFVKPFKPNLKREWKWVHFRYGWYTWYGCFLTPLAYLHAQVRVKLYNISVLSVPFVPKKTNRR